MDRVTAVRTMMVDPDFQPKDCVEFVCRYVGLTRDADFPYPNEKMLTKKAVTKALGTKPKRKCDYGDLVLYKTSDHSGIGISLGYCLATTVEQNGALYAVRIPWPKTKRYLFWSPD